MDGDLFGDLAAGLRALRDPCGNASLTLEIGPWAFRLDGLTSDPLDALLTRWGAFAFRGARGRPATVRRISLVKGPPGLFLPHWERFERYRIDAGIGGGVPVVRSYHFAMVPDDAPGSWRAAINLPSDEPLERVVENVVRILVARAAAEQGGFALHGAGAVREGRAYILAGASQSGKTSAMIRLAPAASLGDDFSVVLPDGSEWATPAVPFDSSDIAPPRPPASSYPVEGIWRLFKSPESRIERISPLRAAASLTACVAFPWTMPDLTEKVLEHVRRFAGTGRFAHLHFGLKGDLWSVLLGSR